jgi:hypothetical protein
LTITGGTDAVKGSGTSIQVKQASGSQSGFLSSSDWTAFNSKLDSIALTTSGNSGASTYAGGILNIPNYTLAGLGGEPLLGYTPENVANKSTLTTLGTSDTLYPTQNAVKSYVDTGLSGKQNTLTNPITGTGTSGQVSFFNGTTTQTGDNGLFWDNTNKRLGIGTNAPVNTLDIVGSLRLTNNNGTNRSSQLRSSESIDNLSVITFYPATGTNVGQSFTVSPRGTGRDANIKAQFSILYTDFIADSVNIEFFTVRAGAERFSITTGKNGTGILRPLLLSAGFGDTFTNPNHLWLYTSGNIGINTTTDAGFRLDVNGTARVQGALTVTGIINMSTGNAVHLTTGFTGTGGNCIYSQGSSTFLINNRNVCVANFFNGGTDLQQGIQFGNNISTLQPPNTASALLELTSTTKGFLPPRLTSAQRDAIASPVAGLVVYNTTDNLLSFYNGTAWTNL